MGSRVANELQRNAMATSTDVQAGIGRQFCLKYSIGKRNIGILCSAVILHFKMDLQQSTEELLVQFDVSQNVVQ